jgi:hypothetical protein
LIKQDQNHRQANDADQAAECEEDEGRSERPSDDEPNWRNTSRAEPPSATTRLGTRWM